MAEEPDYYAVLGIDSGADLAAVRLAFRRLARLYHPDVVGSGSLARMQQLNAAYHMLSDPALRQAYDARRGAILTTPGSSPPPTKESGVAYTGTLSHTDGPLQRLASLPPVGEMPVAALSFASSGPFLGVGLLDGSIRLWDIRVPRVVSAFGFNIAGGILQDLRVSPNGALAIAWGFQLGTRVWSAATGQSLWQIGAYGPSGVVDAALFDSPPWVRLALPDAPLTLSEEDPFRWAVDGRLGTQVLNRPLAGPVDPAWSVPDRCAEVRPPRRGYPMSDVPWRVQQRILSGNGSLLLTISTGRLDRLPYARVFRLWELDTRRGVRGGSGSRCRSEIGQPAEYFKFPIAVSPELGVACARFQERELRLFSLRAEDERHQSLLMSHLGDDAELALSYGGHYLAVASGHRLDLFDTRQGRHLQQWHMATSVTALAFAPDASRILLGLALENGLTELWCSAREP